jgi:sugar/nucleoside kinase (ribokinase family)
MTGFVAIGNISIDDLVFADGTTMWRVPGGNSIYCSLGMAVWGERPVVVAPVGPEYPVEQLGGRIDLSRCRRLAHTLRDWGLYEEDGTRHFVFRSTTRNWLDFSPTVDDLGDGPYSYCHLAPLPWHLQITFVEALRAGGAVLISVDPDDRYVSSIPRSDIARLLHLADMFMPSRQDVSAMFPGRPPLDALRALRDLAPDMPLIVVKCGSEGAIAHRAGASDYISIPTVTSQSVDDTGAGDAFCGGALVGYARSGDGVDAILRGSVSASFSIAAIGPAGLVDAPAEIAEQRLVALGRRVETHMF